MYFVSILVKCVCTLLRACVQLTACRVVTESKANGIPFENKGNAFVGYTPRESIKTLSFATITNAIGSAVN